MNIETTQTTAKERPLFRTRKIDDGLKLSVALPGIPQDQIEVIVEKQILKVAAQRQNLTDAPARDHEARLYELNLQIHEDFDQGNIAAAHQNGILTLSLVKRKEVAPRRIDILPN